MCLKTKNNIAENFKEIAVNVYNNKYNSNVDDFLKLQEKLSNLSPIACKDQYFGVLRIEKNAHSFCEWIIPPICLDSENTEEKRSLVKKRNQNEDKIKKYISQNAAKTIVIVLESPHTDEFLKEEEWKAIGPACGTTGRNLYKWLPEVLLNYVPCMIGLKKDNYKATYNSNKDIMQDCYAIKLVNAIQYQCSLGDKTEVFRDEVFSNMWNDDTIVSLRKRLNEVAPQIIINCCTKGYVSDKEKELRYLVQKEINNRNKTDSCLLLRAAHPSSLYFKNGLSWVDKEED